MFPHLMTYEDGSKVRDPPQIANNPSLSSFAELKKNCSPDLIIYIVGSKADLHRHRQVTSDLARLSLHTWFPPPKPPTPPPPPPPQPSTLSYIRPRFTSFTSIRSVPTPPPPQLLPESPPHLDPQINRQSGLKRSSTGASRSRPGAGGAVTRSKSVTATGRIAQQTRFGNQAGGWNEIEETSSNSLPEADEDALEIEGEEWGLHKGMELFEVSAKDDLGSLSSLLLWALLTTFKVSRVFSTP